MFDEDTDAERQIHLFPEDRSPPVDVDVEALRLRVSALRLERPRPWGACWLADGLRTTRLTARATAFWNTASRRRKLKGYWKRLGELKRQLVDKPMRRDERLEKIGAAKERAGRQAITWMHVDVVAVKPQSATEAGEAETTARTRRRTHASHGV